MVWVIAMLLTGQPALLYDIEPFNTERACQIYLRDHVAPVVQDAFKVACISVPG